MGDGANRRRGVRRASDDRIVDDGVGYARMREEKVNTVLDDGCSRSPRRT